MYLQVQNSILQRDKKRINLNWWGLRPGTRHELVLNGPLERENRELDFLQYTDIWICQDTALGESRAKVTPYCFARWDIASR